MNTKQIGEMIRTRRMSRGMSQEQLADAIGVSPSAIGMYEAGRRKPKEHIIEAMADVFNVPKWAILYNEDEVMPKEPTTEDEVWQIREDFRRNPDLRAIFDLSRNATPEQMKQIKKVIKALRGTDEDTD